MVQRRRAELECLPAYLPFWRRVTGENVHMHVIAGAGEGLSPIKYPSLKWTRKGSLGECGRAG